MINLVFIIIKYLIQQLKYIFNIIFMFIDFVSTLIVYRIKVFLWLSFALIKGRMRVLRIIWDFMRIKFWNYVKSLNWFVKHCLSHPSSLSTMSKEKWRKDVSKFNWLWIFLPTPTLIFLNWYFSSPNQILTYSKFVHKLNPTLGTNWTDSSCTPIHICIKLPKYYLIYKMFDKN